MDAIYNVLEALKIAPFILLCVLSPVAFPKDYSKSVSLFERPQEHALIVARHYEPVNDRATWLVPFAACLGAALPLCRFDGPADAEKPGTTLVRLLQTLSTFVTMTIIVFVVFPLAPAFGSDSRPMPLTVRPTAAVYLAAFLPVILNAFVAVYSYRK